MYRAGSTTRTTCGLTRPGESGRLEREPLPVHLDKVLKAFGDGLEESEKLHVNAGERCLGMAKAVGMALDGQGFY